MQSRELALDTRGRHVIDLTDQVATFAREVGGDGLVHVFVPHATAGVIIMETGAGSEGDLEAALERLLPREDRWYRHRHGRPGHGADHLLPVFTSPSTTVPVQGGRLLLGTWQHVCLLDLNEDNPRRRVLLSFLSG